MSARTSVRTVRIGRSSAVKNAAYQRSKRMAKYQSGRYPARSMVPMRISRAGEIKGVDTNIDEVRIPQTFTTNDAVLPLNLIQSGAGSFNRIGRLIRMKSVRLIGNLVWAITPDDTTGDAIDTTVRMVVIYDSQPNGILPTFDTIFGTTTQTGTELTDAPFDPLKYDYMERFKVLRDMKFALPPVSFAAGNNSSRLLTTPFDVFIKLKGLSTTYRQDSSPSTIADIATGALYVIYRATFDTDNAYCNVDGLARLRYSDK